MKYRVVMRRDKRFEVQGREWFWPFPIKLGWVSASLCCDGGSVPLICDTLEEANAKCKDFIRKRNRERYRREWAE